MTTANSNTPQKWSRYKYPESLYKHGTLLLVLLFLGYSLNFLNVDIPLLLGALGGLVGVVSDRYYPPDTRDPARKGGLVDNSGR